MYSFSYNGIICLLKDIIYQKNRPSHIPSIIKNENNRIYKVKCAELREQSKMIDPVTIETGKKAAKPDFTISSVKNFMKIAKKSLNSNN